VKIIEIEHIFDRTEDFRRSKTNSLMHLQWYIILGAATCRQLWTTLSS